MRGLFYTSFLLTTVIPKTRTNIKEPRPITTTAIAQSGMPPTSSDSIDGAGSGLACTESVKKYYINTPLY